MAETGTRKPVFKKKAPRTSGRNRRATDIEDVESEESLILTSKPSNRFQKPALTKKKKDITKYINASDYVEVSEANKVDAGQSLDTAIDEGVTIENLSELLSEIQAQIQAQVKPTPETIESPPKKYVPVLTQRDNLKISKKDLVNEYRNDDQLADPEDIVDYADEDDDIDATDLMTEGNDKLYLGREAPRLPDVSNYNMEIDDISESGPTIQQLESQLKDININREIARVADIIAAQKQDQEAALRDITSFQEEIMTINHKQQLLVEKLIQQSQR